MLDDDFAISSNSRSKLNVFRYAETDQAPPINKTSPAKTSNTKDNDGKENEVVGAHGDAKSLSASKENPSTQNKDNNPAKECPHTPANRIPLADLIRNAEDATRPGPDKDITPDDHVFWQHGPRSSDPEAMSTTNTPAPRGKKRGQSSSPIGSPKNDSAIKEPFDLQAFQKMLKTPQSDMATDLWNSYIGKNSEHPATGAQAPLFSHLMASSPRTPVSAKSGRDSSGLRRSISCAVDWPTSKAKRRRVDSGNQANNAFARSKSAFVAGRKSSSSKIGLLVEKIQESLSKPSHEDLSGPSSSSPLPERTGNMDEFTSSSPIQRGADSDMMHTPSKEAVRANPNERSDNANTGPGGNNEDQFSSSEFGDDDLDQDFLDLADSTMNQLPPDGPIARKPPETTNEHAVKPPVAVSLDNYGTKYEGCRQGGDHISAPVSHSHPTNNDNDEFDDDDDEFADGMEELLAQYDTKGNHSKGVASTTGAHAKVATPAPFSPNAGNDKSYQGKEVDNLALLSGDEFDDDIDLDVFDDTLLKAAEIASKQNKHKPSQAIKRYAIVDTAENMYVNSKGRKQIEKVLSVVDEKSQENKVISLRESWFDCPYTKGSFIHLIGGFDAAGQCVVDDSQNMIILHPDHLLSATVVADSFTCNRRAVLQDRVKATSDPSRPQVYGHILHEIFQEAMKANRWELDWLNSKIDDVLPKYMESLYTIHVEPSEATEYLASKMPALKAWASLFVRSRPTSDSFVEDRHGSNTKLSINKLLEVEEHVWSPMYGLKGNVDATVQVTMSDNAGQKTLVVPLEVKTGRSSTNEGHRAQTALYTLLLSDRYDVEVTFGILYYLEATKSLRVQGIRSEIRQMLQQRNRLANYVRQRTELPPMLKRAHICNQCYSKTTCFTYHKLVDDGDEETSGVGPSFLDVVGHLTPPHQAFFKKWDDLLTKEEKDMMRFRRELWTMVSCERETLGRCFSNVVIEPGSGYEDKDGPKINRFRYTFTKQKFQPGFSFADSQITIGEPIVISDEKGHFALANGYVVNVNSRHITVAVDRRLHNARVQEPKFDAERNQVFKGIMEITEDGRTSVKSSISEDADGEPTLYRLDKDEFSNGMATVRNNLVRLMGKDHLRAQEIRNLVIEGTAPRFGPSPSSASVLSSSAHSQLNADQHKAVEKVMSAQDYALVLGMPGTGKTTTIAHIIRALVLQGKSVLLTSYTHTAVDNILLKIRDDNIPILRLGAPSKVHPEVQQFADLAGSSAPKTMEQLKASYEDSKVVATTCLGVNHPIFRERVFDYCIVDEASQITLPVCLGPILMTQTFILFGDHYQLPPLVQNKEAQEGGLDVSLFKFLSDAQPSSVVNLEHQYRMCEDIMELSNTLIYSGHLKCGTPAVASRALSIPNMGGLKRHHANPLALTASQSQKALCLGANHGRCWIRDILDPSTKACLVNTDTLAHPYQALDSAKGSRIVNEIEATVCAQLVEALISTGVPARDIGVITFYRSQLSILKQKLRHHLPDLEMHTADKFQGRDKEVVLLSCVRSNPDHNLGDLLRDWRRINVAFTRARTKLLVLGSKATLREGNELLGQFVHLMDRRRWCYDLPPKAVEGHIFPSTDDFGFTQQQGQQQQKQRVNSNPGSPTAKKNNIKNGSAILSPAKNKANAGPNGAGVRKQPEKRGGKMLDGGKIIGSRPVLRDLANDAFG